MALKPNEINQLNVVSFQTNFTRIPNIDFFCQSVNIPSIALGLYLQGTTFMDQPIEGDKLTLEQLNISFYVNEDLSNYLEIYNWMIALGFPDNYNQFTLSDRLTDSGDTSTQFRSDMNVILNTNKSNPNFNVTFKDAFPVSLGAINLEVTSTSLEPIAVEASFAYSGSFSIEKIK
tara:strand:+ start:725 stop:1249 length:525 start_codon:yes stop_codon:yes gene_type:complete